MPMTDGQQVCRNMHHPDGIMINGKAHDLAKKGNAIFTNCLKIVTSATVHDARFVIEGPVSLAQASPTRSVAMRTTRRSGTPPHGASSWPPRATTASSSICASSTMTTRRVRSPRPNAQLDLRPTRRRTHTLF